MWYNGPSTCIGRPDVYPIGGICLMCRPRAYQNADKHARLGGAIFPVVRYSRLLDN
jgi:hypothetical protein